MRLLDGALGLLLCVQALWLCTDPDANGLPLPANWANAFLGNPDFGGIRVRAEQFTLGWNGRLRLSGLECRDATGGHRVLQAERATVTFGAGAAWWTPRQVTLAEAVCHLPPEHAPDAGSAPLLRRIHLQLERRGDRWHMPAFAALHRDIRIRGSGVLPEPETRMPPDALYRIAARVAGEAGQLKVFAKPTVAFRLNPTESPEAVAVQLRCSSPALNHPRLSGRRVLATSRFIAASGAGMRADGPLRIRAAELSAHNPDTVAKSVVAHVRHPWLPGTSTSGPGQIALAAAELRIEHARLTAPVLHLDSAFWPEVEFAGAASGPDGGYGISGRLNAESGTGKLRANGHPDLAALLPPELASHIPAIAFERPPHYRLRFDFGENFNPGRIRFRMDADRWRFRGMRFDSAHVRGTLDDGELRIATARVRRNGQQLDADLRLDTDSGAFRAGLSGALRPSDYNALLPPWWSRVLRDFDVAAGKNVSADFAIRGDLRAPEESRFFGTVVTDGIRYRGVPVNGGTLRIRGGSDEVSLDLRKVRSRGGQIDGRIRFTSAEAETQPTGATRFQLRSTLPVESLLPLLDPDLRQQLDAIRTSRPPNLRLTGILFDTRPPQESGRSFFDLQASVPGDLDFPPLPTLRGPDFFLRIRPDGLYLREGRFSYAGGNAAVAADLVPRANDGAPLLRFRLELNDAERRKALDQLGKAFRENGDYARAETDAAPGRLDLRLHAEGPADDAYQFNGYGDFTLEESDLASIRLLGPLSRILENTRLGFTSFALNHMAGRFTWEGATLRFGNIRIDGPRTRIDADGTYGLDDREFDMRVTASLFRNVDTGGTNIERVRDMLRPLPNLLEFRVTGPVDDPEWRSLYDPRNLVPGL